jgi:hypothetical protein
LELAHNGFHVGVSVEHRNQPLGGLSERLTQAGYQLRSGKDIFERLFTFAYEKEQGIVRRALPERVYHVVGQRRLPDVYVSLTPIGL